VIAVRTKLKVVLASTGAAVLLAGGSTVALAAATGGLGSNGSALAFAPFGPAAGGSASACTVPSLPGTTVDVTETDMGAGMMGGYGHGATGWRGYGGMMRGNSGSGRSGYGYGMMSGAMSVQVSPTTVTTGTVSLRVANDGSITHELVVLPLASRAQVGQRAVGSDGKVNEDASLGEASATCAGGTGDGIAAGSDGWVTLTLAPGRYELVCNIAGHYAAGMHTELDVTR